MFSASISRFLSNPLTNTQIHICYDPENCLVQQVSWRRSTFWSANGFVAISAWKPSLFERGGIRWSEFTMSGSIAAFYIPHFILLALCCSTLLKIFHSLVSMLIFMFSCVRSCVYICFMCLYVFCVCFLLLILGMCSRRFYDCKSA